MKYSKGESENGSAFYEKTIFKNNNSLAVKAKSYDEIFPLEISDYSFFSRIIIESSFRELSELKDKCIWISRESALPKNTNIDSSNIIWVSGLETWKKIAKRGIWVNGSSDGLGEDIDSNIQQLTQNEWIKLTHRDAPPSKIKKVIPTYKLEKNKISHNLDNKTYFYWMSSSAFKLALSEFPSIRDKFHFCGPGNTYNEIKNILGKDSKNLFIELSYKDWKSNILSSTK